MSQNAEKNVVLNRPAGEMKVKIRNNKTKQSIFWEIIMALSPDFFTSNPASAGTAMPQPGVPG